MVEQHFVTFYSPGTFFDEQTSKPVDSWDPDLAVEMAKEITERYGAVPYGFQFTTRGREDHELDSREIARDNRIFYLRGTIETLEQIEARNDPNERILIGNMKSNNWNRIVRRPTHHPGWMWRKPLNENDIVLEQVDD